MKTCCLLIVLLFCKCSFAQNSFFNYSYIDLAVQSIDAPTTDSLAKKLALTAKTDLEKARAVYSWISSHIYYNIGVYSWRTTREVKYSQIDDTASVWKSPDEMVADGVLKKRMTVCSGYSKLFKTLCEYLGLKCELIFGYVRVPGAKERFKTNHIWNAVMIDSAWHLVDVTWGSGYVNHKNEFIQSPDDYYFLTPPQELIRDHFPEDAKWTMLQQVPVLYEFKNSPFKTKYFVKYGIASHTPYAGIIEASVGDTLTIEMKLIDAGRTGKIASSNFSEELSEYSKAYAVIEPDKKYGETVVYKYVVPSPQKKWLQLAFNKDIILQYRLNVKDKVENSFSN